MTAKRLLSNDTRLSTSKYARVYWYVFWYSSFSHKKSGVSKIDENKFTSVCSTNSSPMSWVKAFLLLSMRPFFANSLGKYRVISTLSNTLDSKTKSFDDCAMGYDSASFSAVAKLRNFMRSKRIGRCGLAFRSNTYSNVS